MVIFISLFPLCNYIATVGADKGPQPLEGIKPLKSKHISILLQIFKDLKATDESKLKISTQNKISIFKSY